MKIGVSSYSFQQLISSGKEMQKSIIKTAKEMGFDGIEFTDLNTPEGITEEQYAAEIREEAEKYSLPVISYTIGADMLKLIDGKNDTEAERVCRKLDVAKVLGAPTLRHDISWGIPEGSGFDGFDSALPVMIAGAKKITEYAKTLGIQTMTENHGYFCQDSERVERIIRGVGDDNFGALIDIGNFCCADEDNLSAVRRLLPYAKHIHAKDFHIKSADGADPGEGFFKTRGGNYLRGAIIGHGNVDTYACLNAIKDSGYNGFISVEFEGMEDCLRGIRIGFENIVKYLGL